MTTKLQYKKLKKKKMCVICREKLPKSYLYARCDRCSINHRINNKKFNDKEIVADIRKMLREIKC